MSGALTLTRRMATCPRTSSIPACFRDASELRAVSAREWDEARRDAQP